MINRLPPAWRTVLICAGLLALAAGIRVYRLGDFSLWYDDLLAVTFADRPWPFTSLTVLTYDCHPPLYYLLLHCWLWLGTGDLVVLLSSTLLSLATVLGLYLTLRKHIGEKQALIAALILAIHPASLFWSHFARMYSLLMLLCILGFHANHLVLAQEKPSRQLRIYLLLAEIGIIYSHLAGWFFLFFLWLYFFLLTAGRPALRRRWLRCHLPVAILGAPGLHFPLAQGGLGHMRVPGLSDFLAGLSFHAAGPSFRSTPWVIAGGALIVLGALLPLWANRQARRFHGLVFVLGPLLLAAICSWAIKPMWHSVRTFAFFVPMTAVSLALLCFPPNRNRALSILGRGIVLALVLIMVAGSLHHNRHFQKSVRFAPIASYIQKQHQAGDLLITDGIRAAMSLKWYLLGPDWDANMRAEVFNCWEQQCSAGGFPRCYRRCIRQFDTGKRGNDPIVLTIPHGKKSLAFSLPPEGRIWTLSQKKTFDERVQSYLGPQWQRLQIVRFQKLSLELFARLPSAP